MTGLSVSIEAAALIDTLTGASADGQALRIDVRPETGSLRMRLAAGPAEFDTVIDEQGVLVFLDPPAAERLRSRTLHASTRDRNPAFYMS